jgi:hypothetical protein
MQLEEYFLATEDRMATQHLIDGDHFQERLGHYFLVKRVDMLSDVA